MHAHKVSRIISILSFAPERLLHKFHKLASETYIFKQNLKACCAFTSNDTNTQPRYEIEDIILPPWPGEFGFEIRYAIPRIELFSESRVKILTKRVPIYPPGVGVYDRKYFELEEKLFTEFKVVRSGGAAVPTKGSSFEFKQRWRRIFKECGYCESNIGETVGIKPFNVAVKMPEGISEIFHRFNFAKYNPLKNFDYNKICKKEIPLHIGVQLRKRVEMPDGRDSDLIKVINFTNNLSQLLQLPVIVYGNDICSDSLKGYLNCYNFSDHQIDNNTTELAVLNKCVIFIAPDSGWADFIAWVNIPIIMQSDKYGSINSYRRVGRVAILQDDVNLKFFDGTVASLFKNPTIL